MSTSPATILDQLAATVCSDADELSVIDIVTELDKSAEMHAFASGLLTDFNDDPVQAILWAAAKGAVANRRSLVVLPGGKAPVIPFPAR